MCGRFSNRFSWKELHDLYRAFLDSDKSDWTPKFNIAPTTQIPVLRHIDGKRRIDLMRWGLIPSWTKPEDFGKFATFNARSDACTDKPSYRGAWKAGRRCIIPASSFFEWQKIDAKAKQPFAIGLGNQGPMSFAGLWEEWRPKDAPPVVSVTMITTEPNPIMEPIHDRMPVIIGDENLPAWLGEEPSTPDQLKAMLVPFPPERMSAWKVSPAVGKVQNQGAELIDALT
jgi:putative SOS response-associated peptidase YedK